MNKEQHLVRQQRRLVARLAELGDSSIATHVVGHSVAPETAASISKLIAALAAINATTGTVRAGIMLDDSTIFTQACAIAKVPVSFAAALTPAERRRLREFTP